MENGKLSVDGVHELYYERYGSGERTLMLLHGGPGISFEYLEPLTTLASDELTVIGYDQLGSGRSDWPDAPADSPLWLMERFSEELEGVREFFGLERMSLLGQSWGGGLALQYALDHPDRVQRLVLSNCGASVPHAYTEMSRLRVELGPDLYMTMVECEANGDLQNPAYLAAVDELYMRHLIRVSGDRETRLAAVRGLDPLFEKTGPAYGYMWGPHEFLLTGAVRHWDVSNRLNEIKAPTLVLCGLYDEVTVAVTKVLAEGIPDCSWIIFGLGAHMTMWEKHAPEYLAVVRDFVMRDA